LHRRYSLRTVRLIMMLGGLGSDMKKSYEKPTLLKREKIVEIAACGIQLPSNFVDNSDDQ
jgi:hypothetical protein